LRFQFVSPFLSTCGLELALGFGSVPISSRPVFLVHAK
jgi:hypothetical protein